MVLLIKAVVGVDRRGDFGGARKTVVAPDANDVSAYPAST